MSQWLQVHALSLPVSSRLKTLLSLPGQNADDSLLRLKEWNAPWPGGMLCILKPKPPPCVRGALLNTGEKKKKENGIIFLAVIAANVLQSGERKLRLGQFWKDKVLSGFHPCPPPAPAPVPMERSWAVCSGPSSLVHKEHPIRYPSPTLPCFPR